MVMLRYLRGRGFLDVLGDALQKVLPGQIGKMIAALVVLTIGLAYLYVRNYPILAKWL
jgi:hypothetical protein